MKLYLICIKCACYREYSKFFDRCFSIKTSKATGYNNAWFHKELTNLLHVKNKLYKKFLYKRSLINTVQLNQIELEIHIFIVCKKGRNLVVHQYYNSIKIT